MPKFPVIKSIALFMSVIVIFFGCNRKETVKTESAESYNRIPTQESEIIVEEVIAVFEKSEIPETIKDEMMGVTISESSKMGFDDLSYLTLTYMGYDGKTHTGNMIVDKNLADEVLLIFEELYEIGFPIESMKLMYKYNGDDNLSMESNNTSAFNDRPVTGGTGLSYHQLGRAIDINPYVNPYVKESKGIVLPASAEMYVNRDVEAQGMINSDSDCVRIFKKYGWTWGGDWKSLKDYQHFEKR